MRLLPPALAILLCAVLPAAASAQTVGGPSAATRGATDVTVSSATVHATLDPNGQPASYRFEYGTTTAYGLQTADQSAGAAIGSEDVTAGLGGLSGDTVYHYRVIAWPDSDPTAIVRGADRTLRTLALPGAATRTVHDTRPDGTTLRGTVDPNRSQTTWYFEWGPTTAYGQQTPAASAGNGTTSVPISYVLGGLAPNTTYHFRTVAISPAGTTRGDDRSFRTFRGPTGITINNLVRHVVYGRSLAIDGVVQGSGLAGLRVVLQAQPFPFRAPFSAIGDAVPISADGSFRVVAPPLQISSRLRVVSRSTPSAVSPVVTASAELRVGAARFRMSGGRYGIQGTVMPRVSGAKVAVQRREGKRWVTVHRTRTAGIGHGHVGYVTTIRQTRNARRYRVVVRPRNAAYANGTSRTVTVTGFGRRR